MLSESCAIIVFGNQLVRYNVASKIRIRKYLTECHCLHVHVVYHIFPACLILYGFILFWQSMVVSLHAAHKVLLMYFLLSCSTWSMDCVQCIKFYSRATHFMSHMSLDRVTQQKLKNTRVFSAPVCQLRYDRYCKLLLFLYLNVHLQKQKASWDT